MSDYLKNKMLSTIFPRVNSQSLMEIEIGASIRKQAGLSTSSGFENLLRQTELIDPDIASCPFSMTVDSWCFELLMELWSFPRSDICGLS